MGRKHGRKRHHKNPSENKPAPVHGAPHENPNAHHCEAIHQERQKKDEPAKWWRNPEWGKVVAESAIAFFTFASFIALWVQLKDAREKFRIDQRPYVWIANPVGERGNMYYEAGADSDAIAVTAHYTNFGKSPALELQWGSGIEILTDKQNKAIGDLKTILPTSKDDFATIIYTVKQGNPPDTIPRLKSTPHAIAVKLFWKYRDASGAKYETDVCMWNMNAYSWGPCDAGNDIRDCQKENCKY